MNHTTIVQLATVMSMLVLGLPSIVIGLWRAYHPSRCSQE